ncbi:MAG: cytochrome b N-terminal domain-containing protein [Bacteroidetes bacterium]|nr:cytochrome b N-terminal domain-containing protein [Bacteroidota bacterium]
MKKDRVSSSYRGFIFHLHPPKVAAASIKFNRTFGMGGMALLLFTLQLITGLLLRFAYVPTPAEAYDSILFIDQEILFGGFIRNIHYWSGIFFVIVTFLHFIRVFYSQAIFVPRRINWIIGMGLLILAILSNFTGYLLPWDQLSYWAVTVATNMLTYIPLAGEWMLSVIRGGDDVGSATLLNFYNFHTGILPIAMVLLMVWHFWKVRKAKGVAIALNEEEERVSTNPHLLLKELTIGLMLLALIFIISALFNAPLQERANPAFSPNPAKAPWYFMGIQELLLHIHPFFAFIVLPLIFFTGLIWMPYAIKEGNQGTWFHSEKGKKLAIQAAWLSLLITPLIVLLEEYVLHFEVWLPSIPKFVSEGLVPMALLLTSFGIYLGILKKRYKPTITELIIALFTVFVVSYIVLTIIGIWFRGESMKLFWPWQI